MVDTIGMECFRKKSARAADILLPDGDIYKARFPESMIQAEDPAAIKYHTVTGNQSHFDSHLYPK